MDRNYFANLLKDPFTRFYIFSPTKMQFKSESTNLPNLIKEVENPLTTLQEIKKRSKENLTKRLAREFPKG
jgi:hypothetical protein